jgi:hypothetical protein
VQDWSAKKKSEREWDSLDEKGRLRCRVQAVGGPDWAG